MVTKQPNSTTNSHVQVGPVSDSIVGTLSFSKTPKDGNRRAIAESYATALRELSQCARESAKLLDSVLAAQVLVSAECKKENILTIWVRGVDMLRSRVPRWGFNVEGILDWEVAALGTEGMWDALHNHLRQMAHDLATSVLERLEVLREQCLCGLLETHPRDPTVSRCSSYRTVVYDRGDGVKLGTRGKIKHPWSIWGEPSQDQHPPPNCSVVCVTECSAHHLCNTELQALAVRRVKMPAWASHFVEKLPAWIVPQLSIVRGDVLKEEVQRAFISVKSKEQADRVVECSEMSGCRQYAAVVIGNRVLLAWSDRDH